MEINKKDLKSISYDFRRISNRLITISYREMKSVLTMFINHIESNEIIFDYIKNCKRVGYDVEKDFAEVAESYGRKVFDLGISEEEEVFTSYKILKYLVETGADPSIIVMGYSKGDTYDERIRAFNNRVALVLIQHIEGYLMKIGIKMGYDEEEKYMVTINGTQVNISKDNSTLNAIQHNNGTDSNDLVKLVTAIKGLIDETIPEEEKETIIESVETIQEQLQSTNPKKGLIKNCMLGLNTAISNLPHAVTLCENIKTFVTYVAEQIK